VEGTTLILLVVIMTYYDHNLNHSSAIASESISLLEFPPLALVWQDSGTLLCPSFLSTISLTSTGISLPVVFCFTFYTTLIQSFACLLPFAIQAIEQIAFADKVSFNLMLVDSSQHYGINLHE